MWLDRTQIWVQNYLNENGSNVADLYAALRRRMRTTAAGSHSTSPDQELHIYVGSVGTDQSLTNCHVLIIYLHEIDHNSFFHKSFCLQHYLSSLDLHVNSDPRFKGLLLYFSSLLFKYFQFWHIYIFYENSIYIVDVVY